MRDPERRPLRAQSQMLPPSLGGTLRSASPVRDRPPPTSTRVLPQGGGGSCTHIWGGKAIPSVDDWVQAFGAWRAGCGIEVEIPADGQVHVSATLLLDDSGPYTGYSLAPWLGGDSGSELSLGPTFAAVPGVPVTWSWVDSVSAGPQTLGFVVRVAPNTEAQPGLGLPISIIWSECGDGSNVEVPPL